VATTILLARHGQTDWNRDRRFQGHADPPLNEAGRDQARALGEQLAGVPLRAIYSSDLRRAAETASLVAGSMGLEPVALPELREIDVGEWSGLTFSEIEDRYPEGVRRHRAGADGWEAGETHAAMQLRIVDAVRRIAASHPDEHVLLVIHGGTMRALLAEAEGVDFAEYRRTRGGIENGSFVPIAVEDGALRRGEAPRGPGRAGGI
jgi:broad specificity phosphatase PhoE